MFGLTPFERKNVMSRGYNPFREFENFERDFFGSTALETMKTDVTEKKDAYILQMDLPGFEKEDIHIDIDDQYLTVTAERKSQQEERRDEDSYVRCERSYGTFTRSFALDDVESDKITASYKNGVLKLELPKKKSSVKATRRLEIR